MLRVPPVSIVLFAAAVGVSGCDRLGAHEQAAAPGPQAAAAAPTDLRPYVGESYADFVASEAGRAYAPADLNIADAGKARLARAMGVSAPGWLIEGGGAEALVFVGCAEGDCAAAAGIVAIDLATGAAFAAVRDSDGRDVLAANPRVEALVAATSPADRWADPEAWAGSEPPPP